MTITKTLSPPRNSDKVTDLLDVGFFIIKDNDVLYVTRSRHPAMFGCDCGHIPCDDQADATDT